MTIVFFKQRSFCPSDGWHSRTAKPLCLTPYYAAFIILTLDNSLHITWLHTLVPILHTWGCSIYFDVSISQVIKSHVRAGKKVKTLDLQSVTLKALLVILINLHSQIDLFLWKHPKIAQIAKIEGEPDRGHSRGLHPGRRRVPRGPGLQHIARLCYR